MTYEVSTKVSSSDQNRAPLSESPTYLKSYLYEVFQYDKEIHWTGTVCRFKQK